MSRGKLLGIAIRGKSRAAMIQLDCAEITREEGIVGDFRGRTGARQITVLSREAWDAVCQDLDQELPWTTRRANLLVDGNELAETTDSLIKIGDIVLQVCGEADPCGRMDEQVKGLTAALRPTWRGGVCCRVLSGGTLRLGDDVVLETIET